MSDAPQTKVCRMCAETIQAAAKVCPHCQSRLSRFALWQHELFGLAVALVLMGMMVGMGLWLESDSTGAQGRAFSRHRDELAVVNAALEIEGKRAQPWLTGSVTNRGTHPWRVREIEVRFLNADGSLLDAQHPRVNDPFVVQPAQDAPFRLELRQLAPAANRGRLHARVQDATDGDLPTKPD